MKVMNLRTILVGALGTVLLCTFCAAQESTERKVIIRCAVIGGMTDTGLWPAIAKRFEDRTGHTIEVVATGNKRAIAPVFEEGNIDLLTMHASDTIINLVADGFGEDPQPWARNDLLIVGPPDDPAGIRGETDAVKALNKIVSSKSKLLTHASLGTNEVLANLLSVGEIELDPAHVISLPSDKHRQMLERASKEHAYTLVGRIPFLNAKIARHDMQIMVQGDSRLRRPYLVIVATRKEPDARQAAARQLAAFLRSAETQEWLKEFGKGTYDDQPLFFPVKINK
jgi:tungstate transport system substrate-binding protein